MDVDTNGRTDDATDGLDSVRDYLDTVEGFIRQKVERIATTRKKLGLPEGMSGNDKGKLRGAKGTIRIITPL